MYELVCILASSKTRGPTVCILASITNLVCILIISSMHSVKTTSGAAGGQSTNNTLVILRGVYYVLCILQYAY